MPNWCSTSYAVCSENKSVLKQICDAINECAESNRVDNIFKKLGIKVSPERSFWSDATLENGVLKFFENSAWSRGRAIVVLQEHFEQETEEDEEDNHLSIYFLSTEISDGVFEKNDEEGIYFPEKYLLYGDNGDEYYNSFEELKKEVQGILNTQTDFLNLEELNQALSEAGEDADNAHVYEVTLTDLE